MPTRRQSMWSVFVVAVSKSKSAVKAALFFRCFVLSRWKIRQTPDMWFPGEQDA